MDKTKHSTHVHHSRALFAGVTIALVATSISVAITCIYVSRYNSLKEENSVLRDGYKLRVMRPDETLTSDYYSLKVEKLVADKTGIPQYLPVPQGYKFITLTLSVKNMTASEQLFLPENHLYLRDDNGMKYDLTGTIDVTQPIAGAIASGDMIQGQVGYLVPDDGRSYKLYFDPYGDDKAGLGIIDLSTIL